ncbi:MAG: hypothetical protein KAI29_04090 [Cyclobacteriaceae bacterium]|nr:hypothetical protein [Cyclobacteriaceae bacterium]
MAIFLKILIPKANQCIRLFLLALIIHFTASQIKAQDNTSLQVSYHQFLNFQLDSCRESLQEVSRNPLSFYLEVLLTSTTVFIEDDYKKYKELKILESELSEKLDHSNFPEAYINFLKSEIKMQWAVLKLKNGEEFSSFGSLKQAYNIAKENVANNPEFLPSYKTLGLMHVLFGAFPDKYNWILSILGIDGNIPLGISELEMVYDSNNFLSLESGLTIALLQSYLLNAPNKSVDLMRSIHGKQSQLLVDYSFVLALLKNAQSEKALSIIEDSEQKYPLPFAIPQLYYVKGEALLQKGLIDEAITNYQLFLSLHSGQNLIKDTYYKIGICYLIKGNQNQQQKYFEESRQNGWAKNEADKNAQLALQSAYVSTKELYQLRYATDGGFYTDALKIHETIDTTKLDNQGKCEFYYRSARLFHKTSSVSDAITYYQKTIKIQKTKSWYYAPNSALQLGLIFISEKNNEEALTYLKMINEYNGYPYENSIRQKAKTASKEID